MNEVVTLLTIAGSDPTGGAGIQADIKTAVKLSVYPFSVITALTAQNSKEFSGIWPVEPLVLKAQINSILAENTPDAIKIGMLGSVENVRVIGEFLKNHDLPNVVFDPVLAPTVGNQKLDSDYVKALVDFIFPFATLVTPNLKEKEQIETVSGRSLEGLCESFLLKGGHMEGEYATDVLYMRTPPEINSLPSSAFPTLNFSHSSLYNHSDILPQAPANNSDIVAVPFRHKKVETINSHGSGCVLSSAIACGLAKNQSIESAVKSGIKFTVEALKASRNLRLGISDYGPTLF